MNLTIAIHDAPGSYSDRWIEYCRNHALDYIAVDCRRSDVVDRIRSAHTLLWNWSHYSPEEQLIARQVVVAAERMGLKVFPNAPTSWHYDDKIAQKYLLESVGAPLAPAHVFVVEKEALKWISETTFPKVFKLRCGAGSQNVRLVNSRKEATRLCRAMFGRGVPALSGGYFADFRRKVRRTKGFGHLVEKLKRMPRSLGTIWHARHLLPRQQGYVYFQDFLSGNAFDTRITVIGCRAFGFLRMNRPGDFRASGSGQIVYDVQKIDPRCLRAAFDTSKTIDGQSIAYDFVFDRTGAPRIVEISYTYVAEAVHNCPGYWDEDLNWRQGHFWPQDLIMQDMIAETAKSKNGHSDIA